MRAALVLSFAFAIGACASAADQLDEVITDASACSEGDTCVVAGATDCSCGAPVNATAVNEVEAAADEVSCCDAFGGCVAVDCAAQLDPRCDVALGRCVADDA